MQTAWLINGAKQPGIHPGDRGLAYGDGLFETIAAPRGLARHFERHWARLCGGCQRLGIPIPDRSDIEADMARLAPGMLDHVVKIIVTRGGGGRGYRPPETVTPTRIVGVFPWPSHPAEHYRRGIRAIICSTRLGENPALAGIKHLCRLENVIAQREVCAADAHEGLMRSSRGHVISGTMSNLFAACGGTLLTPRVDRCGIAGVMRSLVIEAAGNLGIDVRERLLSTSDLQHANELFVCNSVLGIWPIAVLGDIEFGVGTITQSLMEHLEVGPSETVDAS